MEIGLSRAQWAGDFPDEVLHLLSDTTRMERAQTLVSAGRIRTAVAAADGDTLMATILPLLTPSPVNVRVNYGDTLDVSCSCDQCQPDDLCEHVLALIMRAREVAGGGNHTGGRETGGRQTGTRQTGTRQTAARQTARRESSERQTEARRPAAAATVPQGVALQFSVTRDDRIEMRPMRRDPEDPARWVGSGSAWKAYTGWRPVSWATPEQVDAIFGLYDIFLSATNHTFGMGGTSVFLDAMPTKVWPALRAAHAAGVVMLPGGGLPDVPLTLAPTAAPLHLDARREGEALTVRAFLDDDAARSARRLIPLGRPMHGVMAVGSDGIALCELTTVYGPDVRDIVQEGQRFYSHAQRALRRDVPALVSQVPVVSSDGSVPASALRRPHMVLSARSVPGALPCVDLTWQVDGEELSDFVAWKIAQQFFHRLELSAPEVLEYPTERDDGRWEQRVIGAADVRALTDEGLEWVRVQEGVELGDIQITRPDEQASDVEVHVRAGGQTDGVAETHAGGRVPMGASQWLDLDIEVRVAGEQVPLELIITALVRGDKDLYLASGRWISLVSEQFQPLRQLIESSRAFAGKSRSRAGLRVSTYDAAAAAALAEVGTVEDPRALAWVKQWENLTQLDEAADTIAIPPQVRATLRDYQVRGVAWASHLWEHGLGGVLADDMGLGKTLQMLSTITIHHGADDPPVLVVAPTSVVAGWEEQAAQFTPHLRVRALRRSLASSGEDIGEICAHTDVLLTSYALARIDAEALAEQPFSALLIDEAQFAKNPTSKTFQALRGLDAGVVIAMTGTPVENSLQDLWAVFSLAAPGLLGSLQQFDRRYRKPIERDGASTERQAPGAARSGLAAERQAELRRLIAPLLLRRTKGEVASELPPKQEQIQTVELHAAHRRRYDQQLQIERERILGLLEDAEQHQVAILRSLTTLRRLALDIRLAPGSGNDEAGAAPGSTGEASAKTRMLLHKLEEVTAEGHRALVFSQFTSYLGLIRAELAAAGIECCYLDGATRDRAAEIERFRSGAAPVFLISLKAGGFGLNLTEADYVFLMDPWWNPAAEDQAVDRTHRIGQRRTVHVYRLVAENTIEQKVLALQDRKRELVAGVIGSGAGTGRGTLSADDVRMLLHEGV